jgi:hypothetical protein
MVRDVIVLLVRQITVNIRDTKSLMICRAIIEMLYQYLEA